MRSNTDQPTAGIPRGGAALALAICLLVSACTSAPRQRLAAPPVLDHAGPVVSVPDEDLLQLSAPMQAFLDRYVLPYENLDTRLDLLTMAVGSSGVLGFRHDPELSLGAAQAFDGRAGNCLSFANMLVAMARASGLEASFQEVFVPRDWSSVDNTWLLEKHINVVVSARNYSYVVDITRTDPGPNPTTRLLGDSEAAALYYANRGVSALLEENIPMAYAYTARAIAMAPSMAGSWVNLGVILRRNGQVDDAAYAQQVALDIDPAETAALSNLYDIYMARGELLRAAEVQRRVEHYRRQNPYYLLRLSEQAVDESRYSDSLELLERALKRKAGDHRLHFALARTQYLLGLRDAAQESFDRARELAPQLARYDRPLPELIARPPDRY